MRFDLRRNTAALHDSIDAAFGKLDLADRGDYARFIQAHRLAARAAEAQLADCPLVADTHLSALLEKDAAAFGLAQDDFVPPALARPQHPLGIAYVLLGSRLGNRLIQRGDYWGKEAPDAGRSDHYLADRSHEAHWRTLVAQLDALGPDDEERRAIEKGAAATFAAFEQALDQVLAGVPA